MQVKRSWNSKAAGCLGDCQRAQLAHPIKLARCEFEELARAAGDVALVNVAVARVADPESVEAGNDDLHEGLEGVRGGEGLRAAKLIPARKLAPSRLLPRLGWPTTSLVPDFFHILAFLLVHRPEVVDIHVVDDQQIVKSFHLDPSVGSPCIHIKVAYVYLSLYALVSSKAFCLGCGNCARTYLEKNFPTTTNTAGPRTMM